MKINMLKSVMVVLFVVSHLSVIYATPVTSNLNLWLDASDLSSITKDAGNVVSEWADKGVVNGAQNANAAGLNQPTYVADAWGAGRSVVRFNGTSNYMVVDTLTNIGIEALNGEWSMFYVFKYGSVAQSSNWTGGVTKHIGVSNTHIVHSRAGVADASGVIAAVDNSGNPQVYTSIYDNKYIEGWQDGINRGSTTLSAANNQDFESGQSWKIARAGNAGIYGDMDIAEILIYDRRLTLAELDQVGTYLEGKWGIDVASIPEPTTVAMLGLGGLISFRRKRR